MVSETEIQPKARPIFTDFARTMGVTCAVDSANSALTCCFPLNLMIVILVINNEKNGSLPAGLAPRVLFFLVSDS